MENLSSPLAIVGISCRLPGANNLDQFWELIRTGGDATGELPEEIIDRDLYYDPRRGVRGKAYTCKGGLVDRLPFDNSKCRLPEEQIKNFDSAHLTICEIASDALRHAKYDPFELPSRNVGVYIGHTGGTNKPGDIAYAIYIEQAALYLHELESLGRLSTDQRESIISQLVLEVRQECDHRTQNPTLSLESNTGAQIVAQAFGLEGPCVVIDAACASSMQALAVAGRALRQGSIDMALVGGASVCKKESLILFSAAQSVSEGKSRPFDEDADGLISSEGYVTLVVKTLEAALAAGDDIHCVVRGIGMSADGKGKSLWAPLKDGQLLAVERAYRDCCFSADDVQYIEAHATSTQVGDATEISALADMFSQRSATAEKIPLGSVKANVGHTLETAGLAGLVKTILAMQNKTIPPCANLENPNSKVAWDELPFYLPRTPQPWSQPAEGVPRKAAINAFGIGGLNVHVVLEEFLPSKPAQYYLPSQTALLNEQSLANEPIAVVGMGMIVPGAESPDEFWNLLETGHDPKIDAPKNRWDTDRYYQPGKYQNYLSYGCRGGFIVDYQYDWRAHKVPPKQVANANPLQFALLDAADRALKASGYGGEKLDKEHVGVVVGTSFGGEFATQLQMGLRLPEIGARLRPRFEALGLTSEEIGHVLHEYEETLLKDMPALVDETGSFTSSTLASRITKTFNLKGGALSLDGGMGTGLAALSACVDTLRGGDCDLMLCAVGDRNMNLTIFEGLSSQGMLSANPRPDFDEQTDGIVPGEGCGVLVLKRLCDAERDGDKVWAVVRGVGAGAAWDQSGRALRLAMQRSLAQADVAPGDLCSIDVVGSLRDLEECTLDQINDLLADQPQNDPLAVSSIVSQFGFMGANHSMASTIKACLSIDHGHLPAGIPSAKPRSNLFPKTEVQPLQKTQPIDSTSRTGIGVLCGAELGTAYHAIIDTAARPVAPSQQTSQDTTTELSNRDNLLIVRLGDYDWGQLRQKLTANTVEQLFQLQDRFLPTDRVRLAIVCHDMREFDEKIRQVMSSWQTLVPDSRESWATQGVFFGQPRADRCSTALLFPGHGSQYPGMFHELIARSPAARTAAVQADAALSLLGSQALPDLIGPEAQGLGSELWNTQASVLLADWIADQALKDHGVRANIVAGHSFGEYAALASAGTWNITDALRAAKHRSEAIGSLQGVEGSMAATSAPLDAVQQVLDASPPGVYLANINSAQQVVISGTTSSLKHASARLKELGFGTVLLKVPCPFHTPMLEPAADDLSHRLQEIPMVEPSASVVSTAGLGEISTRGEIVSSLRSQLVTKVDFPTILAKVVGRRPALIVEVGPKQVLTKLARKSYPQSEVVFMATDNSARPAELALVDIRAQAECLNCLTPGSAAREPTLRGRRGDAQLIVFDATKRRRDRMRDKSRDTSEVTTSSPKDSGNGSPNGSASVATSTNGPPRVGGAVVSSVEPTRPATSFSNRTSLDHTRPSPVREITPALAAAPASFAQEGAVQARLQGVVSASPSSPAVVAVEIVEIRRILVEFVVEQTGYPEDIIELDADLEADLGIDSIKKAQLFGEVGAHFTIAPREDLSLDDFPTLGHVLEFLVAELGANSSGNLAVVETPVAAESLPALVAPSNSADIDEIRRVLVNFVVEQTGYPEDIIELDADLEADLGIDSIKKAQLFGEVGAHFTIAPREDLSLDDFPTLGHVLEFLAHELASGSSVLSSKNNDKQITQIEPAIATETIEQDQSFQSNGRHDVPPRRAATAEESADFLRVEALYGTADQRGKQYGQTFRQEVQSSLATRIDSWGESTSAQSASWPCALGDALVAVAEGASVNKEAVIAINNRLEPFAAWPIGFTPGSGKSPAGMGGALEAVIQVHHELGRLTYLAVNLVGQLHVRAAINSAHLAVSCEPLSDVAMESDVVAITGRLHQILAQATTVAAAQEQLQGIELQRTWCIGLSDNKHASPDYIVIENGQSIANRASTQQRAFHEGLASGAGKLLIYGRNSSQLMEIDPNHYFNEAPSAPAAPVADSAMVMSRHILRVTPLSLPPANARTACQGQKFFLLGQNEVANTLAQLVVDHGGTAEVFFDATALMQRLETTSPQHLVLLPFAVTEPRELKDDSTTELFLDIFQACQKWIATLEEHGTTAGASLSAITRMGGDLGFQTSVTDYTGGGLTGFAKAIRRDFPAIRVKALDCDDLTTPLEAAGNLLEELSSDAGDLEVAIHAGQRHVVRAIATPAVCDGEIQPDGVWVVTGGGRGVTSVVARELAARYNLKLHLLGTAPVPDPDAVWHGMNSDQIKDLKRQTAIEARQQGVSPADQWRRIEKAIELDENFQLLKESGVEWRYHCCDVSDRSSLNDTLETIRREHGPIEGILHGAGIEAACRFSRKQVEVVRATIASKCDGARNLVALTRQDPLRYFVSFGSTSGRFGGLGQADYSLSSDLLAKMMGTLSSQRPETKAICFHWPAWGDVGMAMRPESRTRLEASGLTYMPALEGVEHIVRELCSSSQESEVLILDRGGPLDTDGTMSRAGAPAKVSPRSQAEMPPPPITSEPAVATTACNSPPEVSKYPLIERFSASGESGRYDAVCRFSPTTDPFLLYHRFRDMPFLPGVISLEAMAEAAQLAVPDKQFVGFSDVRFEKGMAFRSDEPMEVTIRVRAHTEGMQCELVAPFVDSRGQVVEQERVFSRGLVLFGEPPQLSPIDPGAPIFGWSPFYHPREITLSHGQPMQSLRQLDYKHGGGRGQIHAGSPMEILGDRQPRNMLVASLALDGSMVCCGFFGYCMLEKEAGLPYGIQEFRQARLPHHYEHCSLRFFYRESNATGELYDLVLLGDSGDVIFEVKGYQTASVLETD